MTLSQITDGQVPEWAGSLIVCLVVLTYVTWGGLRGTAWANTLQTLVVMVLGGLAFFWITSRLGGLEAALDRVANAEPALLVRGDRVRPLKLLTYMVLPLSVGMFPHIFMHWLTARRAESFRLSIVVYPLCVALVWLPSVLLGVIGAADPLHLVAGHPTRADQRVLNRVVQRVAHMQRPGDVRGRNGDRVRVARPGRVGIQRTRLQPRLQPARL